MSFTLLYRSIEGVTNGWNLAALVAILVAGLLIKRNRELTEILKASQTADSLRALNAVLWRFEIDTESLTPEQKLKLATDQLKFRHRAQRQRRLFYAFLSFLGAVVLVSVVNKIIPDASKIETVEQRPSPAQARVESTDGQDRIVGEVPPRQPTVLPFSVRLIGDTTMDEEEPSYNETITVTVFSNQSPVEVLRNGDLFLVKISENESITIHISVKRGDITLYRTVVISGYTATEVPCDRRTIYLAKRPIRLTTKVVAEARQRLGDVANCSSIDKAVVLWDAIKSSASRKKLPPSVKNISDLIEFSDKANYQACVSLGYERECNLGPRHDLRPNAAFALRIAYSRHRQIFDSHDYLTAAQSAEELLQRFDENSQAWEQIRISRSRLHADAAVSWLHYGESLTSTIDHGEAEQRCSAFKKALAHAQNAQWRDFRADSGHFAR